MHHGFCFGERLKQQGFGTMRSKTQETTRFRNHAGQNM
jgi:hypothetical protein